MDPVTLALAKSWVEGQFGDSRIVEMGSNSNGWYVRWENGLQVCWRTDFTISFSASNETNATWVYPAAFIEAPFRTAMSQGGNITYTMEFIMGSGLAETNFYAKIESAQTTTRPIMLFALGRWK